MISCQIGEHRHIERNTEHPLLRQRMRGNLHHRIARPLRHRFVKQARQFERLRGRMRRRISPPRNVVFDRSNQRALTPRSAQYRFDQERRRTLPIRSCNPDDGQSLGGMLVEILAHPRQRAASVWDQRPRHSLARILLRRIGNDRHRPSLDRLVDKAIPIRTLPPHSDEGAAGLHPPRVVFHTANVRVPAHAEELRALQKMFESHC